VAIEQFVTDDALKTKLQIVLQTWPLYRVFHYNGVDQVVAVPKYLTLFCDNCAKDTFWETSLYSGETNKHGFTEKTFKCRNCGSRDTTYYFYWKKEQQSTEFFKVGQYPELEERVSESLEHALTPEDLKMYKNALRLRNFNLGIAAVAYMRRVVENRMNDMLKVLHDAARVHNAPAEVLARHEEVKSEKRFSVKVDYAGDLLPSNLRPAGHPNPMAVLHELASDGLHAKSDEECVDIFDECRQTFEYVFGKMRIETEEATAFVKGMAKLAEKRAKAGEAKQTASSNAEKDGPK
jgi:hypothetical protein